MNKPKGNDKKEPAFKVVDKRRFDDEGREKDEAPQDQSAPSSKAPEAEPKKSPAHDEAHDQAAHAPLSFAMFIQSLAHQVMMGLGIVPWPDTKLVRKDLSLARETIDLLLILKTKTAGNLDKEEEALLSGLLYQLQVAFVEISETTSGPSGGGSIIT